MLATFERPTHAPTPEPLHIDAHSSGSNFDKAVTQRKNISPGLSTITKIGSTTKAELLHILSCGAQPTAKYKEHMKLLWARDEVKFDGENWYV
jgi:hypothetical protein